MRLTLKLHGRPLRVAFLDIDAPRAVSEDDMHRALEAAAAALDPRPVVVALEPEPEPEV